jgi:2,3-bisphosphoglycerate-independent phosphoglycerate mutase
MKPRHRILMLFLDGVGIGRADPSINPFFTAKLPNLAKLLDGNLPHLRQRRIVTDQASLVPLNATLGVAGLPQSGTGQTTLFTAINAAKLIGKHFGPYPYSSLRPIITEHNIFRKIIRNGGKVFYANAYPQRYFDHLAAHRNRITVMVMSWLSLGLPLNDLNVLRQGRALSADVTGEGWIKQGFGEVPIISPHLAGEQLVSILEDYDFVLYDYFFTDHAGHSQSMRQAVELLEMLDEFIGGITNSLDHKRMTFLLTSDHGNFEDLSTKSHTRNPVPLFAVGAGRGHLTGRAKNLRHITPLVIESLSR